MGDQSSNTESSPARAPAREPELKPVRTAFAEPPQVRKIPVSARAVGSYVPRLTKTAMQKFGFSTAALMTDWAAIVGADLARYTRPRKLKWPRGEETYGETPAEPSGRSGATLYLQVDAARALDVQYKGRQIVERINSYFGYRAVADLRIEQMPLPAQEKSALPRQVVVPRPGKPRSTVNLDHISDDRLRAALEKVQKGIGRR